jgi:hypothetical protein
MLLGYFEKVCERMKAGTRSKRGLIFALFYKPEPTAPENCPSTKCDIATGARCAMSGVSLWRMMCGNIPVFSLFTFFPD